MSNINIVMKVTIDREGCVSCGQCWETCPEFFEENPEDGWSRVSAKHTSEGKLGEGEVPQDLEECVQSAAEGCPVQVIHAE
jgi:ferredoxin